MNWYVYASCNPVNRIDPTGLDDEEYWDDYYSYTDGYNYDDGNEDTEDYEESWNNYYNDWVQWEKDYDMWDDYNEPFEKLNNKFKDFEDNPDRVAIEKRGGIQLRPYFNDYEAFAKLIFNLDSGIHYINTQVGEMPATHGIIIYIEWNNGTKYFAATEYVNDKMIVDAMDITGNSNLRNNIWEMDPDPIWYEGAIPTTRRELADRQSDFAILFNRLSEDDWSVNGTTMLEKNYLSTESEVYSAVRDRMYAAYSAYFELDREGLHYSLPGPNSNTYLSFVIESTCGVGAWNKLAPSNRYGLGAVGALWWQNPSQIAIPFTMFNGGAGAPMAANNIIKAIPNEAVRNYYLNK